MNKNKHEQDTIQTKTKKPKGKCNFYSIRKDGIYERTDQYPDGKKLSSEKDSEVWTRLTTIDKKPFIQYETNKN